MKLTYKKAHEVFECRDGVLYWKVSNTNRVKIGDSVGGALNRGYLHVRYKNIHYSVHRIIWLMYYKEWPKQIDHINHNKSDNHITNLRDVSQAENTRNASLSKANTSGLTGVCWAPKNNRWRAYINDLGKQIHLGLYKNISDAAHARKNAEKKYGYHKNHGIKK